MQAPIIMMSQNRQEAKDRRRAEYDYQVNIKAEKEIRALHEKLDSQIKQHNEWITVVKRLQDKLDDPSKSL